MDDRLKQRLVGAAVLVALAVVFIPLVLKGPPSEPERGAEVPVALNPPPEERFSSRIVPLEESAPEAPRARTGGASGSGEGGGPARGWAVQIGAFAEARNALGLRERLRGRGYDAFAETVERDGRQVTRVLVGPSSERGEAERALARLREATSLGGILVRYPER